VTAIVTGATNALQESAGDAVKAAYAKLKRLVAGRLCDDQAGRTALEQVEGKNAEVWKAPLASSLREHMADEDEELVRAAQELLTQADPEGARAGKYHVTVTNSQGFQIGDHNQATMVFQDE